MTTSEEQTRRITQAAQVWVGRYRWQLIPVARLVVLVQQRLPAGTDSATSEEIERLCKEEAGAELFDACVRGGLHTASAAEQDRREIAYHDLSTYLSAIAPHVRPAPGVAWTDLVQETLVTIHQEHRACKQPAAFLDWVVAILRRKAAGTWRQLRDDISLDAEGEPAEEHEQAAQARRMETRERHVDPLGDQEVYRALHDCLDTDEERTLALAFVAGLKRRELGLLFDTPLARWDRVRLAMKRKLAECAQFAALFARPLRPA